MRRSASPAVPQPLGFVDLDLPTPPAYVRVGRNPYIEINIASHPLTYNDKISNQEEIESIYDYERGNKHIYLL